MAGGYEGGFRVAWRLQPRVWGFVGGYVPRFWVWPGVTTWGLGFGWRLQPRVWGLVNGYNLGFKVWLEDTT